MNFAAYVTRRTLFALLTVYLVLTATFAIVAFTPDTNKQATIAQMERHGASQEEINDFIEHYEAERGLDDSMAVRYADWLADVTTLDFGQSTSMRAPVSEVLWPAIQRTAFYTIPAVLLAVLLGTLFGTISGAFPNSTPDWVVRVGSYAAVGVPVFIAAFLVFWKLPLDFDWVNLLQWRGPPFYIMGRVTSPNSGLWPTWKPWRFLVPAAVFALSLIGWQLRYVRTAYLDRDGGELAKLHRAKGAGNLRVARHVLRNAAVPIVSASLSELLVVVLLNIYVIESVFGIEGLAAINMIAVRTRDMSLIIASSLALALGGVLASYVQDLLYGYLDPRIGAGT
ncbi:ABC transporter permease [Halobacterium zhouii]|uniref:ABC transporter permease n=1 Tax=Halobacterium zhouii TaxID=2902624 RepID=UPI001E325E45|nr:ABC transporter permease [Halobacterium zhouii]